MDKLKVLELFGGIGACTQALKRLNIDFEVADYVEIDKYAVKSYNSMNNTNFESQDITKWDKDIEVDLIMHGSPCFVAGTKVITNNGYKNIEDIQVGDLVLTHKNRYRKVLKIGHNLNKDVLLITSNNHYIIDTIVTPNHPFYVVTKGENVLTEPYWKAVGDLTREDYVHILYDGEILKIPVSELNIEKPTQKYTVYNLEVEEDNSYTANNFIVHNCQDFSLAGKQAGGDKGSGTRSSLMYETIRIVGKLKPKYVIWENVKNVLSKKHIHNFNNYLTAMEDMGYKNYYQVLNAKDYGIPQNRERVFTVSIKKEIDNKNFKFPKKESLLLRLKDILEDKVDEKYYLSEAQINRIKTTTYNVGKTRIQEKDHCDTLCARDWKDPKCVRIGGMYDKENVKHQAGSVYDIDGLSPTLNTMQGGNLEPHILILNGTKQGYIEATQGDSINLSFPTSNTRRGRVGHGVSQTLQCNNMMGTIDKNMQIRKLTPKECWRLMGFDDDVFEKAQQVNSNTQLYKQAGNSIVVDVLEKILNNLLKGN